MNFHALLPRAADGDLRDAADHFMAGCTRQLDAALDELHRLAAAPVVVALPEVQVGMTHARVRHVENHFGAARFELRPLDSNGPR